MDSGSVCSLSLAAREMADESTCSLWKAWPGSAGTVGSAGEESLGHGMK